VCPHNTVVVRECSVQCEFTQLENVSVYSGGASVYCSHLLENRSDTVMSTAIPGEVGGRHPPSKYCIWALSKKMETKGALLDELTGGRPKMSEETIQNVKDRLQASPQEVNAPVFTGIGVVQKHLSTCCEKCEASCAPYLRAPRIKTA
jgi:hypothetical protein